MLGSNLRLLSPLLEGQLLHLSADVAGYVVPPEVRVPPLGARRVASVEGAAVGFEIALLRVVAARLEEFGFEFCSELKTTMLVGLAG